MVGGMEPSTPTQDSLIRHLREREHALIYAHAFLVSAMLHDHRPSIDTLKAIVRGIEQRAPSIRTDYDHHRLRLGV